MIRAWRRRLDTSCRYDETAAQDRAATARELLALYRRRRADLSGSSESWSR